ncbi:hypothetical protein [Pseudoxanthomonas sp. SGNA-20]|uniref:hypothetical protein n=1 Tax=Pseudoxanthomonas sp. SGNA-20 TaxID=2493088 RepID=UPI001319CF69|nr:hypothetical protein [Pseudoxanthomonas sp. SGNA-20]
MERAAGFAGFLAAHGIWCVADGEPLVPMPGQEPSADGRPDRCAVRRGPFLRPGPANPQDRRPVPQCRIGTGFAVYPPGFVDWQGEGEPDLRAAGAAFFRGVQSHGEAAAVRADHFVDPA